MSKASTKSVRETAQQLITKACFLASLIALVLLFNTLSVYSSDNENPVAVRRLDDDGYLYYMDYTKDNYG